MRCLTCCPCVDPLSYVNRISGRVRCGKAQQEWLTVKTSFSSGWPMARWLPASLNANSVVLACSHFLTHPEVLCPLPLQGVLASAPMCLCRRGGPRTAVVHSSCLFRTGAGKLSVKDQVFVEIWGLYSLGQLPCAAPVASR